MKHVQALRYNWDNFNQNFQSQIIKLPHIGNERNEDEYTTNKLKRQTCILFKSEI